MLSVQSLAELDVNAVNQKLLFLRQLLAEELPNAQLQHGVINDLVLNPAAILAAARDEDVERVRITNNLQDIIDNSAIAEPDDVDKFMSTFYRIERESGSKAVGTLTIVVEDSFPVAIAGGTVFTAGSQQFITTGAFLAVADLANATAENDRLLVERSDGSFAFNIDVEAVEAGVASMLKRGTMLTASVAIRKLVIIYAESDFTGGVDTESTERLLSRLPAGLASRTLSNRLGIAAQIRDAFPTTQAVSVIGYGDSEMVRDRHSILPVSLGGRVDCFTQSSALPVERTIEVKATLVEKVADYGIWQYAFDRDVFPGFYDYMRIVPAGSPETVGSLSLVSDIRGVDMTNIAGQLTPDVETVVEGAFSRFQTAVVQFRDDISSHAALEAGDEADYELVLRGMPYMAELQTMLAARNMRNPAGDILARAPVPCYLRISFTLEAKTGAPLPDYSAIQQQLANYVNTLGFTGRLSASALTAEIYELLPPYIAVGAIDMFGQIRRPTGVITPIRSTETLEIPAVASDLVSPRTTLFLLDPRSVTISLRVVNVL